MLFNIINFNLSNEKILFWSIFFSQIIFLIISSYNIKPEKSSRRANIFSLIAILFVLLLIIIQISHLLTDIFVNKVPNYTEDIGFIATMLGVLSILLVNRTTLVKSPPTTENDLPIGSADIKELNNTKQTLREENRLKVKIINNYKRRIRNIKEFVNNTTKLKLTANLVIFFALAFIILCVYLFLFPQSLSKYDRALVEANNVMDFLSMLFSAIAILIAAIAFKKTTSIPKLSLRIFSARAEKEGPALAIDNDNTVTTCIPLSSWDIFLSNTGEVSAKNPIVKIRFRDMYFAKDSFPGWEAVEHAHAYGWYGFEWTPKQNQSQVVHVGFDYQLPTLYLSGNPVINELSIEVLIAADEVETKIQTIPVRIVRS